MSAYFGAYEAAGFQTTEEACGERERWKQRERWRREGEEEARGRGGGETKRWRREGSTSEEVKRIHEEGGGRGANGDRGWGGRVGGLGRGHTVSRWFAVEKRKG